MNKLSRQKQNQLVLVGVATALVCAAIWYFLVVAQQATLQEVLKQGKETTEKISKAEMVIKQAPQVYETYSTRSNLLHGIEATMATGDTYSWIITTVNQFASPYKDVNIPVFNPATIGDFDLFPKLPYQAATFRVQGTAHYHELGRFLADFENGFPFLMVRKLDITPSKDPERLDFTMDIVALVKP